MSEPSESQGSRAVLIGTGRYAHDDLAPIPAASANITDLAAALTAPGSAFTAEHCETIYEPNHPSEVGDALGRAAHEATDILLVYYTGHGVIDRRGRLHFTVTDSDPDPQRLRWTAVPFEPLREEILDSPARIRILILDCCFAGRAFEAMSDLSTLVAGQTDIRGTYTLASCSANESSFAPVTLRNTAFTAALLSAVTPGVTLDELYRETDRYLQRNGFPRPRRRNVDIAGELRLFGKPTASPPDQLPAGQSETTPAGPLRPDQPTTPASSTPEPAKPQRITRRRLLISGAIATPLTAGAVWGVTRLSSSPPSVHPSCVATLTGSTLGVWDLAFSPDSAQLANIHSDRTVALWNVVTEPPEPTVFSTTTAVNKRLAFSPDTNNALLAIGFSNVVDLWSTSTRPPSKESPRLQVIDYDTFTNVSPLLAFNQDASLLASVDYYLKVRLWDTHTHQLAATLPMGGIGTTGHSISSMAAMAFNQDGTLLTLAIPEFDDGPVPVQQPEPSLEQPESQEFSLQQWNVHTQPPSATPLTFPGAIKSLTTAACSPQGRYLAACFGDTLRAWDLATQEPIGPPLAPPTARVNSLAFSPTTNVLAAGNNDNTVQLWSLRTTPPEVITLHGHTAPVTSVAFSPDKRLLASGSEDKTIRLWDTLELGLFTI